MWSLYRAVWIIQSNLDSWLVICNFFYKSVESWKFMILCADIFFYRNYFVTWDNAREHQKSTSSYCLDMCWFVCWKYNSLSLWKFILQTTLKIFQSYYKTFQGFDRLCHCKSYEKENCDNSMSQFSFHWNMVGKSLFNCARTYFFIGIIL